MKKTALIAPLIVISLLAGMITIQPSSARGELVAQAISPTPRLVDTAFTNKAANLRVHMNDLLKEHTVMTGELVTALYEGKDTRRLDQLLQQNENELSDVVFTTYGNETRAAFVRLWTNHMNEYKNYTHARKQDNTIAMRSAKENLQRIGNDMGILFDRAGNNLSAPAITQLMADHSNGTLSLIDAVANDNATMKADLLKQGYDQAGVFADALVKGMILDKPALFQK